MPETEPTRARLLRATQTLSAKLNILLLGAMVLIFALLGYLNVRLHRQHLEQNTLLSAERISDVIKQGTTDYMPPFRELAPHPIVSASSTATLAPRRARVRAAESPVNPAPITATSTTPGTGCDASVVGNPVVVSQ